MDNIDFVGQTPTPPDDCAGTTIPIDINSCSVSPTQLHNTLAGLQGGTVNQYYHLTKQEHDNLFSDTSAFMDLHSDQTADGIKTFLRSPQVPDGANPQDAVAFNQLATLSNTFTNGLTNTSGTVTLGGSLTGTTNIDVGVNALAIYSLGLGDTPGVGVNILPGQATLIANSPGSLGLGASLTTLWSGTETISQMAVTTASQATSITMMTSSSGITVQDDIHLKGISYTANYSAANTSNPRWIPDKAYVDSHSSTYSFTNGLTNTSGTVKPGGTVNSGDILYTLTYASNSDHYYFDVRGGDSGDAVHFAGLHTSYLNTASLTGTTGDGSYYGVSMADATIGSTGVNIGWYNPGFNRRVDLGFDSAGIVFTNTGSNGAARYAADYSSSFTTRSLIDKGYADNTYLTLVRKVNFLGAFLSGTQVFAPYSVIADGLYNIYAQACIASYSSPLTINVTYTDYLSVTQTLTMATFSSITNQLVPAVSIIAKTGTTITITYTGGATAYEAAWTIARAA